MTSDKTPRAPTKPTTIETHGIRRHDDYAWLRADNWQTVMRDPSALAPEIQAYLDAENDYQQAQMAHTEALQETLFAEMKGRIKEDDRSVPSPDGPYAYASRFEIGGQHPKIIRTRRDGSDETVLLDGDALAAGTSYFQLGGADHSPDHRLLAWAFDDKGSEYYTLRVRDTETGTDMSTEIPDTGGGGLFCGKGKHLFYVRLDDNHRPSKLLRHQLGTDTADDTLIYEEKDAGFFMSAGKTQSGKLILIDIHDHQTSEVWMLPAQQPTGTPVLIAQREEAIEYSVEEHNDLLYILTNADQAEDFKIVTAPIGTPDRSHWKDWVPHKAGRLILSHTLYKDFMVRLEREDGLPRIVITELASGSEHEIAFDEQAYSLGLSDGYEFDTDTLRFTYSSMTTASRVYDYNMRTRERSMRKEQEVPSGHNPADYETRRIYAPAADGETIPISILMRAGTTLDASAPLLLYGYGAYGATIPASFSTNRLSLVDRGFIYAIAHIRGGKDKGFRWYRDGRRENKTNTFTDFIACAHHLVSNQYTASDRLIAHGGSAGGMLMGAIANMAPTQFAGIIADVPFVDVLTTMLDDTLPLTPPEWPEWGNPIADPAAYQTIAGYSPVDNVTTQNYPAILALAGLTDPRVTYWEPAKWVATLRARKTDDNCLMLKTNMSAGHGGASGRFDQLREVALIQAFALMVAGHPQATGAH